MIQIDRLRAMAGEAMLEYQAALTGGGEPSYPHWADDLLMVCERAEAALPTSPFHATHKVRQREYSSSAA